MLLEILELRPAEVLELFWREHLDLEEKGVFYDAIYFDVA